MSTLYLVQNDKAELSQLGDDYPTKSSRGFYIPARYVLVGLLFFGANVMFLSMTSMSSAIVAMVKKVEPDLANCSMSQGWCANATLAEDTSCPRTDSENSTSIAEFQAPYAWSPKIQGFVLGGYYYGYAFIQFAAGRMADSVWTKWLLGIGMLLGSICTMLVPVTADWSVIALIIMRVLTAFTQGVFLPCVQTLLVRWVPEDEKNLMFSIIATGGNLAIVICMPIVSALCKSDIAGGWPSAFYFLGGYGVLWSVIWMLLSYSDPSEHPRISEEELNYIKQHAPEKGPKTPQIPWGAILRSGPVWAYVFSFCCSSWIFFTRLTQLPMYLDEVLHFPISENGSINALVNSCCLILVLTSGYLSGQIITRKWLSKTKTRKLYEGTALIGTSACMIGVIHSGCNATAVITFLTLASGVLGISNNADLVLAMDLAPSFSGTMFGMANTLSSSTGFISALLTGFILDNPDMELTAKWHTVFYISAGIGLAGGLVALFFWTADIQPWDPSYVDPDQRTVFELEMDIKSKKKEASISSKDNSTDIKQTTKTPKSNGEEQKF